MTTFWEELRNRRQPDGLIVPRGINPGPDSTGNGILYLSLAHVCAVLNRYPVNAAMFGSVISACYEVPGILNRSPTKKGDQTGWDDYVGMAAASFLMGDHHTAWISLNAGNHRRFLLFKWFFKNDRPQEHPFWDIRTWKAWFGRNPSVITHLQFSSGVWPSYLRLLWWSLDTLRKAKWSMGKDHDSIILAYLQVLCWDRHWHRPWCVEFAVSVFKSKLESTYGSFKGVLSHRLDVDHPIITHWPTKV